MNLAEARKISAHLSDGTMRPDWYVWTGGWYELGGEENYYFSHDYLTPDSTVLEVGTYRGNFARRILSEYDCWYIGYEPAMTAFEVAKSELSSFEKAVVLPIGVWDKTDSAELYDVQRDSANLFSSGKSEIVPLMDIVSVFEEIENHVDLFVMNCEGAEFRILQRMIDKGLISRVDRMMLQWHNVIPYAFANWIMLESQLAETHKMIWNLGSWELWQSQE